MDEVMGQRPLGVVLAGGASRRLGRDKAALPIGGKPSAERVREALAAACAEVVRVGGPGAEVADLEPGAGPLQALVAAGRWARERGYAGVVVAGCDLPLLDAATARRLAAPLVGAEARVPEVDGQRQWLAAHYGAGALRRLEAAWEAGERSLKRALAEVVIVDEGGWQARALMDIDTAEALAAVEALVTADQGSAEPA